MDPEGLEIWLLPPVPTTTVMTLLAPAGGAQSFDPMHSSQLHSNEAMPFALTYLTLQVCTLLAWARAKYPLQSPTEQRADRLVD